MSTERLVVPPALEGERLDRAVCTMIGMSRSLAAELIRSGKVSIGGSACLRRSEKVVTGAVVEVAMAEVDAADAAFGGREPQVVWFDESLVVVDKPAGVVVHPGSGTRHDTLSEGLLERFPDMAGVGDPKRPGIVHRLDKGTSGLLVVARTQAAYDSLVAQIAERSVERRYLCLASGHIEANDGVIEAPIGRSKRDPTRMTVSADGKAARSRYEVLERLGGEDKATYAKVTLDTGRTHQVRVHLSVIGHPLVGDTRYGGPAAGLTRPFLHAFSLAITHPSSGERLQWRSELPGDLATALQGWRSPSG